jgi:hypothetical protein
MASFDIATTFHDIALLQVVKEKIHPLQESLRYLRLAKPDFEKLDHVYMISRTAFWVAFIQFRLWKLNATPSADVLTALNAAQNIADQRRADLSALHTLDAVESKQMMANEVEVKRISHFGYYVSLEENMVEQAWTWLQNGKARSVSDILGLGSLIPARVLSIVQASSAASHHLQRESELVLNLGPAGTARPEERLKMREELSAIREQISNVPVSRRF